MNIHVLIYSNPSLVINLGRQHKLYIQRMIERRLDPIRFRDCRVTLWLSVYPATETGRTTAGASGQALSIDSNIEPYSFVPTLHTLGYMFLGLESRGMMTKSHTGRCYEQRGYSDIIGNIFRENYCLEKTITYQLSLEDYKTLITAKYRTSTS